MINLEILTATNVDRIREIGPDLAKTYQVAFSGPPWFEVSRCGAADCIVGLSSLAIGGSCLDCGSNLEEAYPAEELIGSWRGMLTGDDAFMEVSYEQDLPQRATIARPTTPEELFKRKYADNPAMEEPLKKLLPNEFVWIEDTFANRERKATGNLADRGETIQRIREYYDVMTIATRTLSEAVVAATLRDCPAKTAVLLGSEGVGKEITNRTFENPGYALPNVPDRRTLMIIKKIGR